MCIFNKLYCILKPGHEFRDVIRSARVIHIAFMLLVSLLFVSTASAQSETAPASTFYYCDSQYCGYQVLYASGQKACEVLISGLDVRGSKLGPPQSWTNAVFVAPTTCKVTVDSDTTDNASGTLSTNSGWVTPVKMCPGGTISEPLGNFSQIDSQDMCICSTTEKFYADAVSRKKCIYTEDMGAYASPPGNPAN